MVNAMQRCRRRAIQDFTFFIVRRQVDPEYRGPSVAGSIFWNVTTHWNSAKIRKHL